MRNNITKRITKLSLLIIIILISMSFLTGCQSADKNESYFDYSGLDYSIFQYDAETNQTKVVWAATLTNNTIYNFNGFSVTFNMYKNSTLVDTKTYNYSRGVEHGDEYTGAFNFYAENEIDSIEYVSWTVNYDSVWQTYITWFIVMIVIVAVFSLIYIFIIINLQLNLDDIFMIISDFFEDSAFGGLSIIIPFVMAAWGIITSYWVPILIVLGGIIAFILVALLAHLIISIVEKDSCFGNFNAETGDDDFDADNEDVADYVNDSNMLMLFTVAKLKEYCSEKGIRGYSSLNKSNLVELIVNHSDDEAIKPSESKTKKKLAKLTSNITFDDIAGLDEAKSAFKEKVIYAFEHKELYEKYGKKAGGGLLLYGLPGTGKTMFAEAASNETDSLFIPIKCSDIKSKWYGESEAKVKNIFEKARKAKKAIIFFDEFEAIGAKRTDDSDNGNNDLVPQILAEMQGVGSSNVKSLIMVIAATNKPWAIDSAFLRPGRFDEKIYIPLPDFEARKKLFELKLKKAPHEGLDFEHLANITDGFNGADIDAFCDKLKMAAINKSIATNTECPITMNDVEQVEDSIKSTVSKEDIEKLLEFENQFQ